MAEEGNIFKKIWEGQMEAYRELRIALKKDSDSNREAETKGLVVDKTFYVKEWFKMFWIPVVIFVFALVIIWRLLDPPPRKRYVDTRRGHHGINKYGERY